MIKTFIHDKEKAVSAVYTSAGYIIHQHRQAIELDGEFISVRPKTFALLLLLIQRPQEVLAKKYLLDNIWDDVAVEEAVLVQSIRELRQLFNNNEIIQTYPRKGYAWSADVQTQPSSSERAPAANQFARPRKYLPYLTMSLAAVILAAIFLFNAPHQKTVATEVVVILPIKNEIPGLDHKWVTLGGMDQLIHYLPADNHTQIMSTEYVLQLMQHAQIPRDYTGGHAAKIFGASGASLVVETSLSGSVEEYRLDYKLRRQRDVKQGVVFDKTLDGALQKLGSIIASHTGAKSDSTDSITQNTFANELMGRALEKMDSGEYQRARSLLNTLKEFDANNVTARQMLAQTLFHLNDYDAAKAEVVAAISIAKPLDSARLHFLLAEIQYRQGVLDAALETLERAESLNQAQNDILYLGYIAQLRGAIQQQNGLLAPALSFYDQAIKYFGTIRCPIGISITHLQAAKLLFAHHENHQAKIQYLAAKKLILDHKLYKLEPMLAEVRAASL
ncbi:MAG: tetratricopeptide repeat protein [Gammaproteobacteria bacterium]|nr:MAG: tetratricopeptide repeat protein [Gammaproteobacteria bacterium]